MSVLEGIDPSWKEEGLEVEARRNSAMGVGRTGHVVEEARPMGAYVVSPRSLRHIPDYV